VQDRVAAMLRFNGSAGNLPLLTIGDYYYSRNKMMEENGDRVGIWHGLLVGVTSRVLWPRGLAWLHCFSVRVD
jgi:hypothetical protein